MTASGQVDVMKHKLLLLLLLLLPNEQKRLRLNKPSPFSFLHLRQLVSRIYRQGGLDNSKQAWLTKWS
jgi:hypothetical protein